MGGNYDNSAPFYDRLSRLVYGNALINAQSCFLSLIPPNSRILIVGGGTGYILEKITDIHPAGLFITYVEISAKMTAIAQKRNIKNNTVSFINKAIEDTNIADEFDVVITPFLFDNYTDEYLPKMFGSIHQMLKPGGIWLNTDFQLTGKWWQYLLLNSMIIFFKLLCGVESWRLPHIQKQFAQHRYKLTNQQCFYGDFVKTFAYRKANGQ
ncbi:class I SAM-dependent methyltransferase [Mucilaginibacter segetis]|uniref:Class I SAM-dependent methyltransferase n=1 Tax=Mucilaginibacter segetis TaxID=2793071 RepID=A0A934PVH1_9SPHI|nr:class I SAM-dependent methyltransferase [Mucilaginibacter segetis]MBK0380397.1 class I SAM-dependent methyltransferase [Mucilaginibacter segetis]